MKLLISILAMVSVAAISITPARADVVTVTTTGVVEQNQIHTGALSGVTPGQPVTMTFTVDSTNFVNSVNFPTRGYPIDKSSFNMAFPSVTVGLQNPFPAGATPYFAIRHNDPAADGFILSDSYEFDGGVPTDQTGAFSQFFDNYYVTYNHGTLSSLNVLDALGTYNYTGLSVFNWTMDDGPFDAMIIDFTQMTISAVPEPASLAMCGIAGLALLARRRR